MKWDYGCVNKHSCPFAIAKVNPMYDDTRGGVGRTEFVPCRTMFLWHHLSRKASDTVSLQHSQPRTFAYVPEHLSRVSMPVSNKLHGERLYCYKSTTCINASK